VYNRTTGRILGVHLFTIPEREIFSLYSGYLINSKRQVVVLDKTGALISSSDASLLDQYGEVVLDKTIADGPWIRGSEASLAVSDLTGWSTIVITPRSTIYGPVTPLFWSLIGVIALIVIVVAVSLRRIINELYEKALRERALEMRVLMGQINPHFLYNTLETIVWKAAQAKLPDIARVAGRLGNLLRMTISGNTPLVSVEQELKQAMLYVDIQKFRYGDKLQFTMGDIPEAILKLQTLKLIIQPCIENAVSHGMRSGDTPLHVSLEAVQEKDALCIRITDDGTPMTDEKLAEVRRNLATATDEEAIAEAALKGGIGLRNIEERLKLYFGPHYGLTIENSSGGVTVTIRLPVLGSNKSN
jgi:sensor histidine kinase YesM